MCPVTPHFFDASFANRKTHRTECFGDDEAPRSLSTGGAIACWMEPKLLQGVHDKGDIYVASHFGEPLGARRRRVAAGHQDDKDVLPEVFRPLPFTKEKPSADAAKHRASIGITGCTS